MIPPSRTPAMHQIGHEGAVPDPRREYLDRYSLAAQLNRRLASARTRSEVGELLLPALEAEMDARVAILVLLDRSSGRPTIFGGTEALRVALGTHLRALPFPELQQAMASGVDLLEEPFRLAVPVPPPGPAEEGVLLIGGARPFGHPESLALEVIGTFLGVLLRQMSLREEVEELRGSIAEAASDPAAPVVLRKQLRAILGTGPGH